MIPVHAPAPQAFSLRAPARRAPRLRTLTAGLAVAAVALLATALPAAAHDQLIDSTPAAGAELDAAPAQVTLNFSADLLVLGEASATTIVMVVDGAERDWATGEVEVAGATVVAPLEPGMPSGTYEVRWQVVSSDGHPITGVVPFSVAETEAPVTPEPTTPAAEASPDPTDTAVATAEPTDAPAAQEDGAGPLPALLIGGGVLVVLIALVLVWWASRRRRGTAGGSDGADA